MLPSSGRSLGERAVTILPANRSIIFADSRFRPSNQQDTPYDFNCDLSGNAIYAKEVFYQKLFWNQPLFAHNNASVELRFSLTCPGFFDSSVIYVVYVTPFLMFTQYDGNPKGTSFLTPQTYSYANNLEIALNNDVRTIPLNTTLVNGNGKIRALDGITTPHIYFRYTPSRGFAFYTDPIGNLGIGVTIQPCSFIEKGHFVHGMGIFDSDVSPTQYVPHRFPMACVFSDCSPNLLPTRYVVIQSQELNKDRRMISFHNGNFSSFVNELAIFSINPIRTGAFHEVGAGDDATVVSLRDDFTPQSFRIQILDERGEVLHASDPLGNLLQTSGVEPADLLSYIGASYTGRGNSNFNNYLVFGYQRIFNGVSTVGNAVLNSASNYIAGGGMKNYTLNNQQLVIADNFFNSISLVPCLPVILSSSSFTPNPLPQASGFSSDTSRRFAYLNNSALYGFFTAFTWYPYINSAIAVTAELDFQTYLVVTSAAGIPGFGFIYVTMFDALTFEIIQMGQLAVFNLLAAPPISFRNIRISHWLKNPNYTLPPSPSGISVGFCFTFLSVQEFGPPNYNAVFINSYGGFAPSPPYKFIVSNNNREDNVQTDYLPPQTDDASYVFGDPLADALEEEVLHEIAGILEYN